MNSELLLCFNDLVSIGVIVSRVQASIKHLMLDMQKGQFGNMLPVLQVRGPVAKWGTREALQSCPLASIPYMAKAGAVLTPCSRHATE